LLVVHPGVKPSLVAITRSDGADLARVTIR
jgi:hypothetical protein